MSWRSVQLRQKANVQDQLILDLFKNKSVHYIGQDQEFAGLLRLDDNAPNLMLYFVQDFWLSELIEGVRSHLGKKYDSFYIGINRYRCVGNDTDIVFDLTDAAGCHLVRLVENVAKSLGYTVTKTGYFDEDLGRYMNFVQPVTWIYGESRAA